jgi:hypothetical protein
MAFCKDFAAEESCPPAPKRTISLVDKVEALDWDLTGALMDVESLKRSRWWHRGALALMALAIMWTH